MRPPGSAAELERRRRRAVTLLEQEESPTLIARIWGIARASLYRWREMSQKAADGLAAKSVPGRPRGLTEAQGRELERRLLQGAPAHGRATEGWTCKRVAEVIRRAFGIAYHPEPVRKSVYGRVQWSAQKPERRARQRDEEESARWQREECPRIKRRRPAASPAGILGRLGCSVPGHFAPPACPSRLPPSSPASIRPCQDLGTQGPDRLAQTAPVGSRLCAAAG
jgi:transposase